MTTKPGESFEEKLYYQIHGGKPPGKSECKSCKQVGKAIFKLIREEVPDAKTKEGKFTTNVYDISYFGIGWNAHRTEFLHRIGGDHDNT